MIFDRTIRNLGRTHRERRPLHCGFLIKAASLDLTHDDWYMDSETIEFATRLTRPQFDCVGKVMAAFPHTGAAKVRIAHTKEECKVQKDPLCNRIVQPPAATAPHS